MKKILNILKSALLKKDVVEIVTSNIDKVKKSKLDKKKIALVVTLILAILALCGVISEAVFVNLFKFIN